MTVVLVEELGPETYIDGSYTGPAGPVELVARGQGVHAPKVGSTVKVEPKRIYVFNAEGAQTRLS